MTVVPLHPKPIAQGVEEMASSILSAHKSTMSMIELTLPVIEKAAKRRRQALLDIEKLTQDRSDSASVEDLHELLDEIEARAQSALGGPLAKDAI